MDIELHSLVFMILILGSYLSAGKLRKETESGELKISPARFLIFVVISGAIYSGGMVAADILSDKPLFDEEPNAISLVLYGLVFGLIFATAALAYSSRRLLQPFRFKTFRNTSIYGVLLASFFSLILFLLITDSASSPALILFFLAGILGGATWGAATLRASKRRIVGDRMIVPRPFSDRWQRETWKAFLIMIIVVGASFLLSRIVFDSKEAWIGLLAGIFLGMMIHHLTWVLLYERRNNVRLVCEYSEPDKAAESTA